LPIGATHVTNDVAIGLRTTLAEAFGSLGRLLAACGLDRPGWLDEARRVWSNTYDDTPPTALAAVPIWRRPWMVVGSGTFAGDVLRHLGVDNVYGDPDWREQFSRMQRGGPFGERLVRHGLGPQDGDQTSCGNH